MFKRYNFIGLIVLCMIFISSCKNDMSVINNISIDDSMPTEKVYDFEFRMTEYGNRVFKLSSPYLERYGQPKNYELYPKGLELTTYDSIGKVTSHITCGYAKHKTKKDIIIAKYNVKMKNDVGDQLQSEYIVCDMRKDSLYSDERVTIITADGEVLEGTKFRSNSSFSNYEISNPTGEISIEEEL